MTNYALDKENQIVTAKDALFKKNYHCLECQHPLQKRMGKFQRPHFFHLIPSSSCKIYGKGATHLTLQEFLQKTNPSLKIEYPFPDIKRVADLIWEEKRLVFEIQCSPLSLQEAKERTQDYALKGYKIVWLLDDQLYNKKKVGAPERFMRKTGYFFSLKRRVIYDQFEILDQEMRTFKGPNLPVNLSLPLEGFFSGDLSDLLRKNPEALSHYQERNLPPFFEGEALQKLKIILFLRKIFFISLEFLLRIIAKK